MGPGHPHLPMVTGSTRLLEAIATKRNSLLVPGEKKGATQPRTTGGPIWEQGLWKGFAGPETTLLDFTPTNEGFLWLSWIMATTVLIVGSEHRSCRSPTPPKFPASGGGGAVRLQMIYSGNLHCTVLKSLRGGDSMCIPLPVTSPKSNTIHRHPPPKPLL